MPLRTEASDSKHWAAWAGDRRRLNRLVEAVEQLMREPVELGLATAAAIAEETTAEALKELADDAQVRGWGPELLADLRERRQKIVDDAYERAKRQVHETFAVTMEAQERELSQTHRGTPIEVIERLDPPSVVALKIHGGDFTAAWRISIRFARTTGVNLEVRAPDTNWVRKAVACLEPELKKGMQWWRHARWVPGIVALSLFAYAVTRALQALLLEENAPAGEVALLTILLVIVQFALFGGGWLALRRLLPGFEVLLPGVKPRGTARAAWVLGVAGTFLLGLIVELVGDVIRL